MNIVKYQEKYKKIWNEFVINSKNATFLLDRNYMDYHSDRFRDHSLMFYDEKEKLLAILPANLSNGILYSHQGLTYGGFIINHKMRAPLMLDIFAELTKYLKFNKITKLIYKAIPHIYHKYPAEEDVYALFRVNAKLFRRDISSAIKLDTPISMSSGKRQRYKKYHDVISFKDNIIHIEEFFEIVSQQLKDKYGVEPTHKYQEIMVLFERFPKNIRLLTGFYQKKMVGGVLIFDCNNLLHTQYLFSNYFGKELSFNSIVIEKLKHIYKDKRTYLDIGISTESNGKYLNNNLINQKEEFGARAICYDQYELDLTKDINGEFK